MESDGEESLRIPHLQRPPRSLHSINSVTYPSHNSPTNSTDEPFSKVLYLGVVSIPALWLVFVLQYTGRLERVSPAVGALFAIEPVLTLLLAWTDSHWLRTLRLDSSGAFNLLATEYGFWFWVHVAYSYALLLWGTLILGSVVFRRPYLYRRQAGAALTGALAPWVANALYISDLSPFAHLDLTPFGFLVMGVAVTWALFRSRLFDIVPIARDTIREDLRDGVIVLGPTDVVIDINPAALAILGIPSAQAIGRPALRTLSDFGELADALDLGSELHTEIAIGSGIERRVHDLRISFVRHEQRIIGRLAILRDITDRKQAEEEMVRSQRLRAVGELSLGISHNLNNLLTAVLGPAGIIESMTDDPSITREARIIIESATRASDLVKQLGRSVRGNKADVLQAVCVAEAVQEAIDSARPRWKFESEAAGININVTNAVIETQPVAATRAGLHDVLLNLLLNAVDAMPDGGSITIAASQIGAEVLITVTDTGTGMEQEVESRVFEPFFTTKMNVGSGLGMSTAYASVNQWGGYMNVDSSLGLGSTFTIGLLVWTEVERLRTDVVQELPPTKEAVSDREPARVLLVEDEEMVRSVVAGMVRQAGHEPTLAESGAEALELFRVNEFEVALIDLGMPGMPGDAVAQALRELDPRLVTVLVTGWNLRDDDPRLSMFDLHLGKPFRATEIQQLIETARQVYENRDDPG